MTLDDLVNVYFESGGTGDGTTRAGIRAVVEALRDDAWSRADTMMWDGRGIKNFFHDILGSDAGEAAGGPIREEGGTDEKRESYSLPTDGAEVSPRLPDPAADVCEWTRDAEAGAFNPSCDEWSKWVYSDPMDDPSSEGYSFCPSCGKPILFKGTP